MRVRTSTNYFERYIQLMYENIEQQLKSGKSLTQSRYYSHVKREFWPKFFWEMYPLAQEYYHELNPYFCFHFYRPELIRFSKTVTVRDGYVTFAQFMLKHFSTLDELGTHFIIHPSLAPLIPPNLTEHFS